MTTDQRVFKPLKWQMELLRAYQEPSNRFICACIGRQAGKSTMLARIADIQARKYPGNRIGWLAPSYAQSEIGFRKVQEITSPYNKYILHSVKKSPPKSIEYKNGSVISFRSVDSPDSIRGETYDFLIVDEARDVTEYGWSDCALPTLATTGGKAICATTPGRKNWYYDLWMAAKEGKSGHVAIHGTTLDNTNCPGIEDFVDSARKLMSQSSFRREILAEFLEEDAEVFRDVKSCLIETPFITNRDDLVITKAYEPGARYHIGIDVARLRDWSVVSILKLTENQDRQIHKELVYWNRFHAETFTVQKSRVHAAWEQYGKPRITVDATGIGDSFVEELRRGPDDIPDSYIDAVKFNNRNKSDMVENLQSDIDHKRLKLPNIIILMNEMLSYQSRVSPSGNVQYDAPSGLHDDCVISLALAAWGGRNSKQRTIVMRNNR